MRRELGRSPELGPPPRPWIPAGVAALLLAYRVHRLFDPALTIDDAFISFRYAEHFAHGLGLVYNVGQRVEGYSNFLWTILMAAGIRIGQDPVFLSIVLSLCAALASIAVLAAWSSALFTKGPSDAQAGALLAALPPILFAAFGSQARYVLSGMETLLFGFLIVIATWLLVMRDRPAPAGCVFALAAMTRPEGVLFFLLAVAGTALHGVQQSASEGGPPTPRANRRGRLRSLMTCSAAFAIPYLCVFVGLWRYYGDPLPNTFYAKASGWDWARIERGFAGLAEVARSWSIYLVVLLGIAALASLLAPGRSRRALTLRLSALYVLATVAYFIDVGGDFLPFFGPRFLMPVLPFALLLATEGLRNCGSLLARWRRLEDPRRSQGAVLAVVAAGLLLGVNAFFYSWPARDFDAPAFARIMESWEDLGRWIGATTPVQAVIADGGAGIVPYYSQRTNIDMYGLTDRHIGHMNPLPSGFKTTAHEKYDPSYVLAQRPDYIVTDMSRDRAPRTAGLVRVKAWLWACYRPWVLLRPQPTPSGDWVTPSRVFTASLYDRGFHTIVFERRHGRAKAGCDAYERAIGILPPP